MLLYLSKELETDFSAQTKEIDKLLFDNPKPIPNNETNQRISTLKSRIEQNTLIHLPQIKLMHLKVTPEDKTLNVNIEYRILLDNDTNEISLIL